MSCKGDWTLAWGDAGVTSVDSMCREFKDYRKVMKASMATYAKASEAGLHANTVLEVEACTLETAVALRKCQEPRQQYKELLVRSRLESPFPLLRDFAMLRDLSDKQLMQHIEERVSHSRQWYERFCGHNSLASLGQMRKMAAVKKRMLRRQANRIKREEPEKASEANLAGLFATDEKGSAE